MTPLPAGLLERLRQVREQAQAARLTGRISLTINYVDGRAANYHLGWEEYQRQMPPEPSTAGSGTTA